MKRISLKSHLWLAVIGERKAGKTTAAIMLTDFFFDLGVRSFQAITSFEENLSVAKDRPSVFIFDGIPEESIARDIQKAGAIVIKIRRNEYGGHSGQSLKKSDHSYMNDYDRWNNTFPSEFHVVNDDTLRKFDLMLRDLVITLMSKHEKFKQAVNIEEHLIKKY